MHAGSTAGVRFPSLFAVPISGRFWWLMTRLFAVIRSRASAWDPSRSLEGQDGWQAHAEFMDALYAEGFVVLVGPLEGTSDALLIVRAENNEQIQSRLSADPWEGHLLRTTRLSPWTLRLGSL
jgi:uncharacterized protein YciI